VRRDYRVGDALDKPVAFESLQRLGQHFFANPADAAPQLAKSLPTLI
jgi:hypothetical protein